MNYSLCILEQFFILLRHKKVQHLLLILVLTVCTCLVAAIVLINYNSQVYIKRMNPNETIILTWDKLHHTNILTFLEKIKKEGKVKETKIYTPKEALSILMKGQKSLIPHEDNLENNPLPYTAVIKCNLNKKEFSEMESRFRQLSGIRDVIVDISNLELMTTLKNNYFYIMSLMTIFFIIAAILLAFFYFYTLFLSRRKELKILRLCGASNFFIVISFMLNGFLSGIIAAALGILLTKVVVVYLNKILNIPPIWIDVKMLPMNYCFILTLGMAIASTLGSIFAINPFLTKGE